MEVQMSNPFRENTPSKPPPGLGNKEWSRIGILGIVLLILIAIMVGIYLSQSGEGSPDPGKTKKVSLPGKQNTGENKAAPGPAKDLEAKAQEALKLLKDGRDKVQTDQRPFLDFLYLTVATSPEEVTKRVDAKIGPDKLLTKPEKYRGKYVRLSGRLIQLYTEPMKVTTVTDTQDVYLGIMQTYPSQLTVAFYMAELPIDSKTGKPMEFHIRQYRGNEIMEDWIQIEGMFLRVYEYEGPPHRNGKKRWVRAPLVFAKNIRPYERPRFKDNKKSFVFVIVAIAGAIALLALIGGFMARKYSSGSIRMKMLALKKEKAKESGREIFPPAKASEPVLGDEVKPPESPPESGP